MFSCRLCCSVPAYCSLYHCCHRRPELRNFPPNVPFIQSYIKPWDTLVYLFLFSRSVPATVDATKLRA